MPHEIHAHPAHHAEGDVCVHGSNAALASLVWNGQDDQFTMFYRSLGASHLYAGDHGSKGFIWYTRAELAFALKDLQVYHANKPWFQPAEEFLSKMIPSATENPCVYISFG